MSGTPIRGFGWWTLTFLVVANMIGAGVFTTSGFTLASLREPSLVILAWLVGGVIALCGAYSYGLLVKRMPVSGGEYAFLSQAAHPFLGFIAGWISLLAGFSGAIAFAAVSFEAYLPELLPHGILAALLVISGAMIHGARTHLGAGIQNATVALKLLMLAVFLAVSFWSLNSGTWNYDALPPLPDESPALAFAQALVWISLSYSGFNAAVYVAGEAASPNVVARALLTGTALVALLYLLLNTVFVLAPPASEIAGQPDVAAIAALAIGGEGFAQFTRLVIAFALLTSVLSMMMAGPRVYGKMADDGLLPKFFALHPERTWPAVCLQLVVALILVFAGSLQDLLSYLGLTLSLSTALSVACLFLGDPSRRITGLRALPPLLFILATLTTATLLVIRDPWQALGTGLTLVIGGLAYFLLGRPSKTSP